MGKPKIRFKGYTEDWEQRKLGDVADLTSSKRVHAQDYVDSGVPFYRGKEITELREHKPVTEILYIAEEKYNEIATLYGSPQEGDILITAVGTIGNTWVVDSVPFYFKDGNLIWFKNIKCKSDYLNYLLSSDEGQKKIDASAIGSNQKALTMIKLNELNFMFPKDNEQTKIANFFSNLDNLITLHQRKCDETKKLKKCMLQKMFPKDGEKVPEIRFSGFAGDWKQRKLSEFGIATGGTSIESEFSEDGIYKVINIGSYSEDGVYRDQGIRAMKTEKTLSRLLNKGDIAMILNDKTSSGNIIGRVILIEESNVYVYNQRTERIEIDNEKYDSQFIYTMLNAPEIRNKIIKQSQGNTQIYVNWSSISQLEYLLPDINEQCQLGSYFRNLDNVITFHQQKCDELKNIKKFMLQNMFVQEK